MHTFMCMYVMSAWTGEQKSKHSASVSSKLCNYGYDRWHRWEEKASFPHRGSKEKTIFLEKDFSFTPS